MACAMTRCVSDRRGFYGTVFFLLTSIATFAAVCCPALGQAAAPDSHSASAKIPTFTVAAIRPDKSGYGSWQGGPTSYGYSAKNVPVTQLISFAYGLKSEGQLVGLPGWTDSERFDVEARMDEDDASAFQKLTGQQQREQSALMLRPLLADRFKLKIHHETRMLPVYALVVAKGGVKLKESHEPGNLDGMVTNRGLIYVRASRIGGRFVEGLSDAAGRIVIDKTGLTGHYDITLKWTPDEDLASGASGPTLFTALEEQLGLRLIPAKDLVEVIVVDHIERPTGN
jgi:uncharacterized protein (TIGR03435 family)